MAENLPDKNSFRFGLKELFYATALIGAGLSVNPGTLILSMFVLVFWSSPTQAQIENLWTIAFLKSTTRCFACLNRHNLQLGCRSPC